MHDDLIDVVEWAVEDGIADRDRVGIMGGSYGGYAALVGLTFTPEVFACAVDIVGPSNLNTLLDTIPPYWQPIIASFRTRVGDNSTEEGRRFLAERSPLSRADEIVRPLLIGQGANDPRVKRAESDQISGCPEPARDSRDLRPLPRRGTQIPSTRKQPVFHGSRRGVPGSAPRRQLRAHRRRP